MSMSRKKCCVPGCMESKSSHRTLHQFPNPEKDSERFNKWVFSIKGDIIGMDDKDIYKHRSVCHAHFEEKYCCRYNKLSNIAVPTLNVPAPVSLPKFTWIERRPMREIQNVSINTPSTSTYLATPSTSGSSTAPPTSASLAAPATSGSSTVPSTSESTATPSTSITSAALLIPECSADIQGYISRRSLVTRVIRKSTTVTPEENKLHRKLTQVRIKLSKCRNKVKKQSAIIKAAKTITENPVLLATMEKLPSTAKILTMMQLREVKKKNKGRRFTLQEKILALSIFKRTPKGYRFLRKIFILPAPQTLAKLITQADLRPGVNKKIFSQLQNVTKNMKEEEKLCILLFDEIFLKANISYNERKDKVIGFVTDGKETKPEFADHAQVYMIRGLIKNYKQPVSYSFSAAATSGQQIAKEIKEIISELQRAGLIVVTTVCDQGANNRQAIKLLLQETRGAYLRKGQEPKDNVILINDQEVIPLYDPPHLLKCIQNNLLTKNLEYYVNETKHTAKWQHLMLLHQENPGYKGVKLIPKLTDNHVLPEKVSRNKMKVKFASQIFSRTVATNMGYLADKGILPKECSETADIILFFDNLFDSLNGSYNKKKEMFSKPLLGPVTPKSIHHKEWAVASKHLKKMKFVHPISSKTENVPTLNNWAWTLDGIEILLKKLEREFKITSVWMRHLNQDPIENFFGAIRSHGCRNTSPSPEKFESAFTTLLINNISSVHAPTGGNCEEDYCKNLHALIVTDACNATTTSVFDNIPNITIEDIEKKSDPRVRAPLTYISGYFIKNSKKRVFQSCVKCANNVIAKEANEYIKYREYAGRQWLCSPTESVVNCISAVQDITNSLLKECLEKNNLKEIIKTYVLMFIEFDFLDCEEHKDNIIDYLINVTARFFIFNYCKNINRILSGRIDCNDDEDGFQMKAKKYLKKCSKRPARHK